MYVRTIRQANAQRWYTTIDSKCNHRDLMCAACPPTTIKLINRQQEKTQDIADNGTEDTPPAGLYPTTETKARCVPPATDAVPSPQNLEMKTVTFHPPPCTSVDQSIAVVHPPSDGLLLGDQLKGPETCGRQFPSCLCGVILLLYDTEIHGAHHKLGESFDRVTENRPPRKNKRAGTALPRVEGSRPRHFSPSSRHVRHKSACFTDAPLATQPTHQDRSSTPARSTSPLKHIK